jgi:hypothetical protein
MKTDTYTQCELVKQNIFQVAWIPSQFAVVGKTLKIKENGIWEDDWKVTHVFGVKLFKKVEEQERDYLKFHVDAKPKEIEKTNNKNLLHKGRYRI